MAIQGRLLLGAAVLVPLLGAAAPAAAQTRADCERQYTPQRAQEGKNVIWAPTEDSMVVRMLELAKVTAADKVYDLGAGDGKIVIAAAKHFGATGVGIEYEAELVEHARCLAAAEGVADRVTFVRGDIFEADFNDATVVAMYLTPTVNERLLPSLLRLKPGTRIVSYSFPIGAWEPDAQIDSFGDGSAFFFLVPANVAGSWTFRPVGGGETFVIDIDQSFQFLTGDALGAKVTGKLSGDELELTFVHDGAETRVTGVVAGDRMTGSVSRGGPARPYVATRH